jgi:hypothetical protein
MTNWFLITSAINVKHGVFDEEKRFQQTLVTIASIRKHCENSKIVLIEGSPNSLTLEQSKVFENTCDIVLDLSQDQLIQFAHQSQDIETLKHPCEIYLLGSFLNSQNVISENDRVYKISGRYYLNSNFNSHLHNAAKNKIVMGHKKKSYNYYDIKSGVEMPAITEYNYKTRLYSFCGSLTNYMKNKYQEMFDFILPFYDSGGFTDIEHIMYKFLDHDKVIEMEPLGVSGIFANGRDGDNEVND